MATAQAKHLHNIMPQFIGHCNSIDDSSFALFCCDCLNTKFVGMMVLIERIMGTLGRIIGKNSENCRREKLAKKRAYLAQA